MEEGLRVRKDLLINNYEIKLSKQIGEGSFGQVWQGTMGTTEVAVKKLIINRVTPYVLRTIEKEIVMLATLHHPNVLQIYGVCICAVDEFWIVMEFADGGSLYSSLSDEDLSITWITRRKWMRDVAESVAFLHKRGVVHRDLKSPNFLLVKGVVKVCDFGMATTASVTSNNSLMSSEIKSAGSIGTTRWLAPECTAKVPVYNSMTDVYGMGMVIWEIASRDIPFKEFKDAQVIVMVKYENERPEIPDDCPTKISEVIQRCWDPDPAARPPAHEVALLLHQEIES